MLWYLKNGESEVLDNNHGISAPHIPTYTLRKCHSFCGAKWRLKMTERAEESAASLNLRSQNSTHKSFVRFLNTTERIVDVVWINYEGHHVKYKSLSPGDFVDANTYVTHPWMFIDSKTQDKLVIKSQEVYCPEPWYVQYMHLRRDEVPPRPERTNVYITIPLYSLKQRSLQVVRDHLLHPEDAFKLELPVALQRELANTIRKNMQTRHINSANARRNAN